MTIPEVAPRLEALSLIISIPNKVCKLFEPNQLQVLTGLTELLAVTHMHITLGAYGLKISPKHVNFFELQQRQDEILQRL